MTISTEVIKAGPFLGNDVTTSFAFTFKTFAKADLRIVKTNTSGVDSDLILDSDYSVTLNADQNNSPGGTVTYPISGSPLATGEKLTIINEPGFTQSSDLRPGTSADVIENAIDKTTILAQRAKEESNRGIKIPVSDTTGLDQELPGATLRASKLMGFDSDGDVEVQTAADVSLVTLGALDPTDTNITKDKILSNAQAKVWEDYVGVGHLPLAGGTLTGALVHGGLVTLKEGTSIASAATIDLSTATGNVLTITGSTGPVTSFGTVPAGRIMFLTFASTPTLTHNATSLKLPGEANIVVVAGDRMILKSLGSGNWECVSYTRKDGKALVETTQPGVFESEFLHIQDQKSTTTNGGTFTSGADRTRDLNTSLTNEITGASLASNQITLPAGTYYCEISAPGADVEEHRAILYDTTGSAILLIGTSEWSFDTGSGSGITTKSIISGRFTLSVESVLEVRHRCKTTTGTYGFGNAHGFGEVEVYTDAKIWKLP